jgi:hypothetical protein
MRRNTRQRPSLFGGSSKDDARLDEWFVPRWGPVGVRVAIGLLFLPYTGMVLSYTVIGSMLAPIVAWDRVGALLFVYFVGLGIGAHALDALGSVGPKPWGEHFSRRGLWIAVAVSLVVSYSIIGHYSIRFAPWFGLIMVAEGFLAFAYNIEWFRGRFHTDKWFTLSWGAVPVLAGYTLQTNTPSLIVASAAAALSLVEITASRPYKVLRRMAERSAEQDQLVARYERILQAVSLGVIALGLGLALFRFTHT